MSTYKPLPVSFTHGNGHYLWDQDDTQYFDALCGISVTSLGHNHPAVTEAIHNQANKLLHTSNLYGIQNQQKLANLLCEHSGMEKVFFSNSGAEANEAAIKLARLYGHKKNISDPQMIVMDHSFHGRTMATLSATGNRKVQAGFEPLVKGFIRAPFNDIEAIKKIANNNKNVVAILVEPIQGEGGINIPDADYLPTLKSICEENDWLFMLDEIQTGMARSGELFAFQYFDFVPDVITIAKALGNGLPIGACLAKGKAANLFQPGNHGSTFGGNPFVCEVATAVLNTIIDQKLAKNAKDRGVQFNIELSSLLKDNSIIQEVRNKGLLIGIALTKPCSEMVSIALEHQLLINVTADNVIRLLPPITISKSETSQLAKTLADCINQFSK